MNPRTTLALLVLVAALGGYVYYFEFGKAAREGEAEAASRQLFKLERDQVTEIELPLEEGGSARLVRANAGADWRIVAPLETGADRETADALLTVAKDTGCDLLVVGNRGMTGARRFVLGSVPNKISHNCPANLLIVDTSTARG